MRSVVYVIVTKLYNMINLFFYCAISNFIWRVIQISLGLGPPNNIRHTFGAWIQNMNTRKRQLFLVGIGVMLWVVWLSQNDIEFDKTLTLSYM
jgi:fructose-specific phosphotransferase system IIC component